MNAKTIAIPISIIVLVIGAYALQLLWDAGAFKTLQSIHLKSCHAVESLPGPEDMAVLEGTPYILISADSRREKNRVAGALFFYDLLENKILDIKTEGALVEFFPHGLSVLKIGTYFLIAVVNQSSSTETRIEYFHFYPDTRQLKWIKSFSNINLLAGNDIALLGEDEFLYTRDFNTKDPQKIRIQQYTRQATGSVWHYKAGEYREKASQLFFANGIVYDSSASIVYVTEMLGHKVHSFQWVSDKLKLLSTVESPHGIDNLTFDGEFLYGAGHPKLLDLKKMRDHREFKSPSAVMQISRDLTNLKIVYQDDGSEIAASSVALRASKDEILIGSVFDNHFLHCQTNF
ncbi:MAG: hypothetical protein J0M15_16365 [Deltaproteobacteria bacterium]|nr:hypothetical protein [Deltaproteobacteria bacterium]